MNVEINAPVIVAAVTVLTAIGSGNAWIINAVCNKRFNEFLKELNGTYVRSLGSKMTGYQIEGELKDHDKRIGDTAKEVTELHTYTHAKLAGEIHKLNKLAEHK